jgi:hypothetical protein
MNPGVQRYQQVNGKRSEGKGKTLPLKGKMETRNSLLANGMR